MQRVFTTTIGRSSAPKISEFKSTFTLRKGAQTAEFRATEITTRKHIRSTAVVKLLAVDGREVFPFEMLYGEELVVTVSANRSVTVLVSEQAHFSEWEEEVANERDGGEVCALGYPPSHVSKEEVRAVTTLNFYATVRGTFLVCLFNISRRKARAAIGIVHWGKNEEGE